MLSKMRNDIDGIIDSTIDLCYYMRGSIGYEEMMLRTPGERQRIHAYINNRLEHQNKLPPEHRIY